MPELPEVETTRRKLEPLLVGRTIHRIVHGAPHKYPDTERAHGLRVMSLRRRGKYLLAELGTPEGEGEGRAEARGAERASVEAGAGGEVLWELIVHLGMTGGFRLEEGRHTRVTLELGEPGSPGSALHFDDPRRFGKLRVVAPGDYAALPTLAAMGPEPLSDDFAQEAFVRLARECGAVKPWLLSQKPVSGVGNIYADESLWRARLHPAQTRLTRPEAGRLYAAVREVMAEAVALGGSSLGNGTGNYRQHDGEWGGFQGQHAVYGKAGAPCPRCGTPIQKTVLAQRGTHFCPRCQRLRARPAPSS